MVAMNSAVRPLMGAVTSTANLGEGIAEAALIALRDSMVAFSPFKDNGDYYKEDVRNYKLVAIREDVIGVANEVVQPLKKILTTPNEQFKAVSAGEDTLPRHENMIVGVFNEGIWNVVGNCTNSIWVRRGTLKLFRNIEFNLNAYGDMLGAKLFIGFEFNHYSKGTLTLTTTDVGLAVLYSEVYREHEHNRVGKSSEQPIVYVRDSVSNFSQRVDPFIPYIVKFGSLAPAKTE